MQYFLMQSIAWNNLCFQGRITSVIENVCKIHYKLLLFFIVCAGFSVRIRAIDTVRKRNYRPQQMKRIFMRMKQSNGFYKR